VIARQECLVARMTLFLLVLRARVKGGAHRQPRVFLLSEDMKVSR